MLKERKRIFFWELTGLFWIVVVGSLLHFTYEWSGKLALVGMVSAVNESVWEHLKLGYWSLFFFSLLEYKYLKSMVQGFFLAKLIGILSMEVFIVVFFYTYTAILGHNLLLLDIGSFVLGAVICQFVSFKILTRKTSSSVNNYSLILFLGLGILFIVFTFSPPNLPIFME